MAVDFQRKNRVLALLVRQGDTKAREEMILLNRGLAGTASWHYNHAVRGTILSREDLFQAGMLGLTHAVDLYDPKLGAFGNYAPYWIRQHILRCIMDARNTIRIPAHIGEVRFRINREWHTITERYGATPSPRQIVNVIGFHESKGRKAYESFVLKALDLPSTQSLDKPIGADIAASLGEIVPDTRIDVEQEVIDNLAHNELAMELMVCMGCLPPRTRDIVRLRYGLENPPLSYQDIADIYGVSKQRIDQIISKALKTLRANPKVQELFAELETD